MLILSRRKNERIVIDERIEVSILDIKGDQVRIGISAPSDVSIFRQEIYANTQKENSSAVVSAQQALSHLSKLKKISDRT